MPRPDPFDFLAQNGIHVRPPTTPPETVQPSTFEASDQDATPKPKPKSKSKVHMSGGDSGVKESDSDARLGTANGEKGGDGEKGMVTQIVLFESPNGATHEELRKSAMQELGGSLEELRRMSRCYSGTQVKTKSKECWVIRFDQGVRDLDIPSADYMKRLLFKIQLSPAGRSGSSESGTGTKNENASSLRLFTTRLRPALLSSQNTEPEALSSTSLPFTAPVTEIAIATLKVYSGSSESNARFEETIGHLIAAFARSNATEVSSKSSEGGSVGSQDAENGDTKGLIGAAWGKVREREDQYVFVFGWESLEAHAAAVRSAYGSSTIMLLQQLADLDFLYVELSEVDAQMQTTT